MNISYFPNLHYWFPLLGKPWNSQALLPQTMSETFCSDYFK